MVKTGLNVFDDTEALLVEALFPEEIEDESDEHKGGSEEIND